MAAQDRRPDGHVTGVKNQAHFLKLLPCFQVDSYRLAAQDRGPDGHDPAAAGGGRGPIPQDSALRPEQLPGQTGHSTGLYHWSTD